MSNSLLIFIMNYICFFTEYSTITTWGKEGEKEAFQNMLEQVCLINNNDNKKLLFLKIFK